MIYTGSRVNSRDLMPMVEVRWDSDEPAGEMTPAEARTFALRVLESAEAAEHDSIVVRFAIDKLGLDPETATGLLVQLRAYRAPSPGEIL